MDKSTIAVDGIEVPFDASKLADQRLVLMMGDLADETLDAGERLAVQARMLRFVFGSERDRIMDEIAAKSGGTLTADALGAWWVAYLTEAGAKN